MKIVIISYSLSGNNAALAERITQQLAADYITITEKSKRGYFRIFIDLFFNRTPKVQPNSVPIENYDYVVLIGPIWMGKVAFPLRSTLQALKRNPKPYAFVSLCSGSNGKHPKLEEELTKRAGTRPDVTIEKHIMSLLPSEVEASYKAVQAYQIKEEEFDSLSKQAVKKLKESLLLFSDQ